MFCTALYYIDVDWAVLYFCLFIFRFVSHSVKMDCTENIKGCFGIQPHCCDFICLHVVIFLGNSFVGGALLSPFSLP